MRLKNSLLHFFNANQRQGQKQKNGYKQKTKIRQPQQINYNG